MKLHWADWAVATVLAGAAGAAGCIAIWAGLTRAMRRVVAERQHETERQLDAMATTVRALEARVAELGRLQQESEAAALNAAAECGPGEKKESPKPEILAAITAAATTFLGKKARIRSAQLLPAEQDSAGAWAQQGRVFVQTSHNLRTRG